MLGVYLSSKLIASWKTKVSKRIQNNRVCHEVKQVNKA